MIYRTRFHGIVNQLITGGGHNLVYPLVMCYLAIEHGPFIVSFPVKHGDFPVRSANVYQRVLETLINTSSAVIVAISDE